VGELHQVIHIGQRKTGTTWLQGTLLKAAEATAAFIVVHKELKSWTHANSRKPTPEVDWKGLSQTVAQWRGQNVVVSLESLISFDHQRMAEALAETMPHATILVTTRAPGDRIQSDYSHSLRIGRLIKPDRFVEKALRSRRARSNDLRSAAEAFGARFAAGIRFLPFELLRDNETAYLDEMTALCGVDLHPYRVIVRNARPPDLYLALVQRVSEQISRLDPNWAHSKECKALLQIAGHSTAYAKEFWPHWEKKLAGFALEFENAEMPATLLAEFATLNEPVRDLPVYQPYLRDYGFQ
jgi:hypothetical protein